MELFRAIEERYSCREFLDEDMDRETIEEIIQSGVLAPSPLNSQPWDFIVITNKDVKEKIESFLPELDVLIGEGLVTLEKVRVIYYRHN